ncbi:MAG: putative membrane protein YfcA [Glaciecola sp.]|jgi:uncharacterized membrane protein YfcA
MPKTQSTDADRSPPARVISAGLAAGLVAGMFGVGGGVLLVPVLVMALGRPQHVAHATSLVAVTLAAVAGAARFGIDGAVSLLGALLLVSGSILGARVGARLLPKIPERRLTQVFGVVLLVLALRFLVVGASGEGAADGDFVPALTAGRVLAHSLGGFAAGVTSSVLGVGGGVIMVPLLSLGLGYGQHIAEGTSLAVIVPTALTGAQRHARNGYTDWTLGLRLGVAAIVGSTLGASIALGLEPVTLGRAFGVLQATVGVLTLARVRRTAAAKDATA